MAGAAFSVGAGNMNAPEFLMGIVQSRTKGYGVVKIFPDGSAAYPAEHRQLCIEIVNRLLVGHTANINPATLPVPGASFPGKNYCTLKLKGTVTIDS